MQLLHLSVVLEHAPVDEQLAGLDPPTREGQQEELAPNFPEFAVSGVRLPLARKRISS